MLTPRPSAPKTHVLTVALEDYFQVGAFNRLIQRGQWYRFEPRFERNTATALEFLDRANIRATFFILGWIADRYPEVVRMVADRGHEIASKGYYHRSIRQMTPSEFQEDLQRSREALERAGRRRVLGYRVAHEWFAPLDLWALDVLAEEGFAYDSSVGPIFRRFAHEPWRRFLHQHQHGSHRLWEFPLSSWECWGWHIPIAGGNYFRQFPHRLVRRAVQHWHKTYDAPFVMYFHVWELDPDQPIINAAPWVTRIRHYRNLDKMAWVLEDYFRRYPFVGIADYLGLETNLGTERLRQLGRQAPVSPMADLRLASAATAVADTPEANWSKRIAPKTAVTIVVPCFNEESILPYLANTLRSVQATLADEYETRFVFVDDGSADGTWQALHRLFGTWPNAAIVSHGRNLGVAAAILTGIRQAETEIVCSIDCDCTYDPHVLKEMIPLLGDGESLITASPYHPLGEVRNVPAWRLLLSRIASFLYRRVLRQKLSTYTSCFRVYRRSAFIGLAIAENGYLGIAEMLARLDLQGGKIVEYPATLEVRMLGRSKMKTLRTILGHLRLLRRLLWMRVLGRGDPGSPMLPGSPVGWASDSQPASTQPERTIA
jgi:polysaccharide deacetylase family protein (PEP-CTERM system associated)